MDTAEYDTNVLVVNNISSIYFRFYEPSPDAFQNFNSVAIEIEGKLKDQGHIVHYDASRRGFWYFRLIAQEGSHDISTKEPETSLILCNQSLTAGEEGFLEPGHLQKPRTNQPPASHAPASSNSCTSAPDQAQRYLVPSSSHAGPGVSQEHEGSGSGSTTVEFKSSQGEPTSSKAVYENFIFATLLTMSAAFCNRTGAIPLDYQTVLLSPSFLGNDGVGEVATDRAATVGTMRAYMTTTGTLVLSMSLTICRGLRSFNDLVNAGPVVPGKRILAAPLGMIATSQLPTPFDGGTASMAQTPNTQALSSRGVLDIHDSLAKRTCSKFLQYRGLAHSKLTDCFWINLLVSKPKLCGIKCDPKRLQTLNPNISIPWPGPLCFRKKAVEVSYTSRVGDTLLSGHEESYDPLGNAQSWFSSGAERQEKIAKRKADRMTASHDASNNDHRPQRPNGQSPMFLRRASAAAAGLMYPTPPDALQNFNGVTPSLDGTLSSPGNPLSVAAVPDAAECNGTDLAITAETFEPGSGLEGSSKKRSDGNLLVEAEHMYEDLSGGDMFADDHVTEDDFNFFDEEPSEMDLDDAIGSIGAESLENNFQQAPESAKEERLAVAEVADPSGDVDVFTKPQLRHAISARNDIGTQRETSCKQTPMKREPSPFDPHTVFKRVRASLVAAGSGTATASEGHRIKKIFEKMDFDPMLPKINKKYEKGGQFDYNKNAGPAKQKLELGTIPETEYLKRHKQNRGSNEQRLPTIALLGSLAGLEAHELGPSPTKLDGHIAGCDPSSDESDQDDSSCLSDDEPTSPLKSSVKQLSGGDDDDASQVTSLKETDTAEEPDHQLATELPRLSKPETPDTPLSVFFSDPEPLCLDLSLSDEDFIQVAQILAEQASVGNLQIYNGTDRLKPGSACEQNGQGIPIDVRASLQSLRDVASFFFRGIEPSRLKSFLDIQDVSLQGPHSRLQPRPVPGRDATAEQMRPSNLYQIPGPHLEMCRSDAKLSVLPSAVTFWESLGLAPSSGSKDITAVCIFPGWKGMKDSAKTFLGRIKSVYEVLRLGSVENLALSADVADGLLPYEVDRISTSPDATLTGHGSALVGSMETMRSALSNLKASDTNVVVYFIYSPNNPGTIVEACAAFQRFFDSYQRELSAKKEPVANELVLQLVSADMMSSPTSMVVTPSSELVRLCVETYDRCTLFGGPMPAPAIRLEQALPRIVDFKLINTPSASLMRENSCIHVAYARTVDERWITAAWTDDRGYQQATSAYCLGRRGKLPSRSLSEVAQEIWVSTLDLVATWKVHWRIIVTKCGPMDQHEVECWTELARADVKASVTVILMTVNSSPSLQFIPPVVRLPQTAATFYTTPVSTPQANNAVSPEQSATPATPTNAAAAAAATPGGEAAGPDSETDAVLVDVTDQTWVAVVGHRLNNSTSVTDLRPALASGYLIKRTGGRMEDAPVAMEVNLIHSDASPRAYEPLLREMLSCFGGLATLSRARGMVPRDTGVGPWHVAAAEKAARAIHLLM
ncbi:uncharacterized protein UV8b_00517 [Ustilaginoidea virens]|uniref:Mediator of RNA polymerase II transcription subunit 13 n=1 Tax=Ustilaginoidea virens TaxID=1159556 RepID=A0A8E5MDI9_USTVR|nr:uncharacterized protein UV8b_00517 [Ustilaginoidea virens]QUC16276.1 hypothetical protein UV8b_00517 [Ustilaginoidea virens]